MVAVEHVEATLGPEAERAEDDVLRDAELLAQRDQLVARLRRTAGAGEPPAEEQPGGGQRGGAGEFTVVRQRCALGVIASAGLVEVCARVLGAATVSSHC
ncbi:hypothetical protein ROS62_00010 [Streptomyces sp. DSM 41972]|uniref:Uncharacterized protein n=1 Tax=Streptomyces althioticus subsp. attaecolombicae TaxID=3075534 RepID=A0ABU3HRN7_9ACTN|nr:hypothetical protein [Streptomyces sp. DSM 41972]SCD32601.1 hypothetical protein GA0115245_10313 [Streptomyces sp. di188]SCD44096.1 hypothetical protein GA0115238_10911 [Streptomyces sp. di50b]